jgi:predicted kinase
MREANDWRLTNQLSYLKGVTLIRESYSAPNNQWDHDHCVFCWIKLMEQGHSGTLSSGYTTEDRRHWICENCYDDFKDLFEWSVLNK